MLENLNFRAFFVRIVAMTSVQNRDFSFGENLYITARLIHPPGSHTMRLYRPCPTPRDKLSQRVSTPSSEANILYWWQKLLLWIGMVFSLLFIVKLYFRLKSREKK